MGQTLSLRVAEVKEDGKLTVSAKQKAYLQLKEDAEAILETIRDEFDGVLPFDDKADPELIQREFGLSKGAFKRAVGHLYKTRIIELKDGRIYVKHLSHNRFAIAFFKEEKESRSLVFDLRDAGIPYHTGLTFDLTDALTGEHIGIVDQDSFYCKLSEHSCKIYIAELAERKDAKDNLQKDKMLWNI